MIVEKKVGGGLSKLSVEKFLSHITETFRRRNLLCCASENFRKRKNLSKKIGEGGVPKVSVDNFLSQNAKNFRRGIF